MKLIINPIAGFNRTEFGSFQFSIEPVIIKIKILLKNAAVIPLVLLTIYDIKYKNG